MTFTSQRKGWRHPRRVRVSMWNAPSYTLEIGPGGFSVEAAHPEKPGTKVEGTLRLDRREVTFQGVVTWSKPGDAARGRLARVGVRFTVLASEVRRKLEAPALPENP